MDNTRSLAIFYTIDGKIEEKYNTLVEKKLKSIGFDLTDPHKRVNDQYKTKYGSTLLDVLSFMPVVNNETILPLLNIDPRIAGFSPFNMLIYKKLDENVTHVGHLMPTAMLDILDIKDQEVREEFSAPFKKLDATIAEELGGKVSYMPYKKLPQKTMINYEYTFETPEDMEDFIDEFQERFELAFIDKGYLIAGYHNFMEATDNAKEILSDYDAFWTYSLCHLEFSYNMFDTIEAKPEAGLFAPCTMYMYIKKGSNKIVIGMFRLHNWSDTLNITNKKRVKLIEKLDIEIPSILETLGMKALPNINPLTVTNSETPTNHTVKESNNSIEEPVKKTSTKKVEENKTANIQEFKIGNKTIKIKIPKAPTAIKCSSSAHTDRSIKFSKRVPPNYVPHRFDKKKKEKSAINTKIGEVYKGKISTYLRGEYMDVAKVEEHLKNAGFKILSSAPITKNDDLISVVFTNEALVSMGSKANRGFIASLRVLVDSKEKRISITNPLYMAKGFLGNDFNEKDAHEILVQLTKQFPNLTNSKDTLKYQLLPNYQFMKGMPHYENMVEVATGSDLLEKIKNSDRVVFSQTLKNGSTLIGIKLSRRTNKFIQRIGRNNAAMLPYPILIENGTAKILDPKYYISFMYPKLTMSEFMTIATVPDAMIKDCEKVFK
jgi:uncharacterized protein (DUF302 family)